MLIWPDSENRPKNKPAYRVQISKFTEFSTVSYLFANNRTIKNHEINYYSSLPNKRPGVAYSFFEKNPGGTLLLGWGRLFFFHKHSRGVVYLGGVADFFGLLRHIFWLFSSKWLQGVINFL